MTPKFEDCTEELKSYVVDLHDLNQAESFNQDIKGITKYVDLELHPIAGKYPRYTKIIIFRNPKKPALAQVESTMDDVYREILQEKINSYIQ